MRKRLHQVVLHALQYPVELILREIEVKRDALEYVRYYVIRVARHLRKRQVLYLILGQFVNLHEHGLYVVHQLEVGYVCAVKLPQFACFFGGQLAGNTVLFFAGAHVDVHRERDEALNHRLTEQLLVDILRSPHFEWHHHRSFLFVFIALSN